MSTHLSPSLLARDLALRDLSDPSAGPHAVQIVVDRAVAVLQQAWGCAVLSATGPRVVAVADNYDALGFARSDVTRDARYTRYVDDDHMLRSHSSAMVPEALRLLASDPSDDVLVVCAGVVFRRDAIDRLHTGTPHQLDLWRITRRRTTEADLTEMIELLCGAVATGRSYRTEPHVHPYTTSGRQVDVDAGGEWVEIAECGLAHRDVLGRAGFDDSWTGLALGMGLDRLVMLAKGLPDIRLLRSSDQRIAAQMTDLGPYRPVSLMPVIRRDISVAIEHDDLVEDLGDRVREALGPDADAIEQISIVSETPCRDLPPAALQRLGARPDQNNVLVRIVLRDLARTLTDADANQLRDRIFAVVHRGAVSTWASDVPPR